jgi:hypothetical protein
MAKPASMRPVSMVSHPVDTKPASSDSLCLKAYQVVTGYEPFWLARIALNVSANPDSKCSRAFVVLPPKR